MTTTEGTEKTYLVTMMLVFEVDASSKEEAEDAACELLDSQIRDCIETGASPSDLVGHENIHVEE